MAGLKQLSLFAPPGENNFYHGKDLGTFKDSMRSPVHRWFRYPAGYSYKFVHLSFELFGVRRGDWVYDPFSGTGTTLVCAKQDGINAYGVEAHSFVHWVAGVKLFWEFDRATLRKQIEQYLKAAQAYLAVHQDTAQTDGVFPELVYKCYHPHDLNTLYLLREFILQHEIDPSLRDLLRLALTDTLRGSAAAGTGWPYISPRKNTGLQPPKNAWKVFYETVWRMVSDLYTIDQAGPAEICNTLGDSRDPQPLAANSVALALTSPPYLNNYDYADRTRLETYFWGITTSWGDITQQFRRKLITAATTQITRSEHRVDQALSQEINALAPQVYATVQRAVLQLAELRPHKGGKKDYDLMVALYFNDVLKVVQETYRVLRPGGHFCLVLGDSAPYGVHIATGKLIGEMGLGVGFKRFYVDSLRTRGEKWKANPQRHNVLLEESVIILKK
jgi:DNA modification methylase